MASVVINKKNRVLIICGLLVAILIISLFVNTGSSNLIKGKSLVIKKELNIPLREISGGAIFHHKRHSKDILYTVGDASAEIFISELDSNKKEISSGYSIDLKEKILEEYSVCNSERVAACKKMINKMTKQWEAIYVDPLQRIYLLNEPLAAILIFDRKQEKFVHTISLDGFLKDENTSRISHDENSQGEGFLPLRNGHILVIKESKPSVIIEYGPGKATASGFNKNLVLNETHNFIVSEKKVKMFPLASWRLPKEYSSCDLSELTHNEDRSLEILSQRCQAIFKVSDLNPKKKTASIEAIWNLPRRLKNSEAFIPLPNQNEFLVFEDLKDTLAKNTYFLSVE